jgi:hypothetical protein
MRSSRRLIGVLSMVAFAGCSSDAVGPATTFGGVQYSAAVNTIQSGSSLTQFTILVTMKNTTTATVTRTYPAGCPVRMRMYRSSDGKRVYDETTRTCTFTDPATITLQSLGTATLTTGPRLPGTVLGDSLPSATYIIRAVVQTEGTTFVEVDAGSYLIGTGPVG